MNSRTLSLICFCGVVLAACAGGREDAATKACTKQIDEQLKDENYRIDAAELRASAKPEDDAIMHLGGVVVFDPGLPREYRQTVDCRVRFVSGQELPNVISLNFTWE